jgi:hypothetical protein
MVIAFTDLDGAARAKVSPKKHHWTEDELDIVRRDYKGTRLSALSIAARLGVTQFAVIGQCQRMGLCLQKSPDWSEDELEKLADLIHTKNVTQIGKILNRSPNAVKIKATRLKLGLRARDDWFTKKEVCEIVGSDHKKVQSWIDCGWLKAAWHTDRKPQKDGMAMWHIEAGDLRGFLVGHSGVLMGRNVDIQQIVWIVAEC